MYLTARHAALRSVALRRQGAELRVIPRASRLPAIPSSWVVYASIVCDRALRPETVEPRLGSPQQFARGSAIL